VAVSLEGLNDLPDTLNLSSCKILLAGDCELPSKLMGGNQSLPSANGAAGELLWLECWRTDSADWIRHATQLVVLATSQVSGSVGFIVSSGDIRHYSAGSSCHKGWYLLVVIAVTYWRESVTQLWAAPPKVA
jgi:hypothetical protein